MRMKAAVLNQQGRERPYRESWPMVVETLELDGPEAGELLVEIEAAGLCHSDLSTIEGIRPRPLPLVPGHEAAGIVRALGKGVEDVEVGDHVVMVFVMSCGACADCVGGRPNLCAVSARAKAQGTLIAGGHRIHLDGRPINHAAGISCFAELGGCHRLRPGGRDLEVDERRRLGPAAWLIAGGHGEWEPGRDVTRARPEPVASQDRTALHH